jgi:hypothetical protein
MLVDTHAHKYNPYHNQYMPLGATPPARWHIMLNILVPVNWGGWFGRGYVSFTHGRTVLWFCGHLSSSCVNLLDAMRKFGLIPKESVNHVTEPSLSILGKCLDLIARKPLHLPNQQCPLALALHKETAQPPRLPWRVDPGGCPFPRRSQYHWVPDVQRPSAA